MNNILFIDGENILHQSFHKFENLKSTDGKPSGAIFGFFKSLHMYLTRFETNQVYISFDNGHSPYRDKLLPNYKGHRKNISYDLESLLSQKHIIMKILGYLRIPYIFDKNKSTNYEGDDFLAYLIIKSNDIKPILISSDKDFNQLIGINHKLRILNPRKDEIIRESNCKDLFGYSPEETVDYLCLVGDTSDDIPGVKGMGPVKARKLLDEYHSISEAIENKCKNWEYIQEVYNRNKQLIDLNYFIKEHPLESLPIHFKDKPLNYEKFKKICISYSMSSFLTNQFIEPFKNLNYGKKNNAIRSIWNR